MNATIQEAARQVPVIHECDICVIGGSCTGVFAALRAARLGASVAIVEKQNCFGGVATSGLVNIWHSTLDTEHTTPIIAGLTTEVVERLKPYDAVKLVDDSPDAMYKLNTEELKIELDAMILEAKVKPFLHTAFVDSILEGDRITHVLVENKSGRGAIKAGMVIDASGDGDVAARAGLPFTIDDHLQPPTTCAKIKGMNGIEMRRLYNEHLEEYDLMEDAGWSGSIPNIEEVRMYAETHVFGANTADADQLTFAEMEGRRHIRAMMNMVRTYHPERRDDLCLLALSSTIGIRETRRFQCEYELTEMDVLNGVAFDDAIGYGSYRVDVHNPTGGGFVFKYLDGRQISIGHGNREWSRWREETAQNPTFYQIPYRTLVNRKIANLILAGRTLCADRPAFGALRVMVNCNQTGEAAGVAAWHALQNKVAVADVEIPTLRRALADGGSILFDL